MQGCLVYLGIILVIIVVIIYVIGIAIAAIAACGATYGAYRALVYYATSLKRIYGSDANYKASSGMKALMVLILMILVIGIFAASSYFRGTGVTNYF